MIIMRSPVEAMEKQEGTAKPPKMVLHCEEPQFVP
jgi:hypothetical protein